MFYGRSVKTGSKGINKMAGDVKTKTSFTRGTWRIVAERGRAPHGYGREFLIGTDDGTTVALLYTTQLDPTDPSIGEVRENANLICAEPDLLNAAESAIEHMEHSTPQGRTAYEFLRLAIDRAKGDPGARR